ncbi:hypothetical protein B1992_01355 [Pseudoxanthomonas broegbernensis]|uniref:GDSL family lipase n=1 Tax=Pseudoxanthomonas broegbernensis TaxID=83619 RepID=A0A7V8K8S6_9GAMM|nr:SGNH/GDSL hydrolase family protein [Pseudoxanthomonas broegbernensis]KAF1688098.1 hypothetical protein B1992_01355 [Pseudoxanthomonas broegbernensis]MBB6065137.1 lysophospholipase L1-like esterase [Pseudoxanthomonas broegbernensis]
MKTLVHATALAACLLWSTAAPAASPTVSRIDAPPPGAVPAPMASGGRVVLDEAGGVKRAAFQWPGAYFETAFHGDGIVFEIGPGQVIVHVEADGRLVQTLVEPAGAYRIAGLGRGEHTVRIDVATESQAGANRFDGFLLPAGATARPLPARAHRIEFIGDSHTVGYGNTSASRDCSQADVWASTDTTRAFAPRVAGHYDADYRVHAISGRGVVRNYDGASGDTLPQAYPYVLFDRSAANDDAWQPEVVVIALGTNDFSTPLRPGEKWETRQALHADYQRTYAGFVRALRARYPRAHFVLWATDLADGEIIAQAAEATALLHRSGETRVSFLPVRGLAMEGCHWHPSVADDRRIADLLIRHIDDLPLSPWRESSAGDQVQSAMPSRR